MKKILCLLVLVFVTTLCFSQAPDWSVDPAGFENTMTVKGVVKIDHIEIDSDGGLLAAFVAGECRGVNSLIYNATTDRYFAFFLIYGSSGEEVTFKYYDHNSGVVLDLLNSYVFEVDGEAGSFSNPFLLKNVDGEASLNSFSFDDTNSSHTVIDGNNVKVYVPENEDLSTLNAYFNISEGATAYVNSTIQESGNSPNDFTNELVYTIVSSDLDTTYWNISVEKAGAEIIAFDFDQITHTNVQIDADQNEILIDVPENTDLTALIADFEASEGAVVSVSNVDQVSGASSLDFSGQVAYQVTSLAQEVETWQISVSRASATIESFDFPDLAIKDINIDQNENEINVFVTADTELSALTAAYSLSDGATAFVNDLKQQSGVTPNDFTNQLAFDIESKAGNTETWRVNVSRSDALVDAFDFQSVIYQSVAIDEKEHEIQVYVSDDVDVSKLVAEFQLSAGAQAFISTAGQVSGVTENDFTNPVFYSVQSAAGEIISWEVQVQRASAEISAFDIPAANFSNVTITATGEITAYVSEETDITDLKATFNVSAGASISINEVDQESGVTTNDFSEEVTYQVTSLAGEEKLWKVSVIKSGAKIIAFDFEEADFSNVIIDEANREISAYVNLDTDLNALKATFDLSSGAIANISGIQQSSGVTVNDFSNELTYSITSLAGEETQWSIQVVNSGADITLFEIPSAAFSDVEISANKEIIAYVSEEISLTELVVSFGISEGAQITVEGIDQSSGVTSNDFTDVVTYKVTSQADEEKLWKVSVIRSGADIISFELNEAKFSNVTIKEGDQKINAYVDLDTDITALKALFNLSSGAKATVSGIEQSAGTSVNDFSNLVTYHVTSLAGEEKEWDVVVSNAGADMSGLDFVNANHQKVTIDQDEMSILVYLSDDSDLTSQVVNYDISEGATVAVEGTVQNNGKTSNNFSNTLTYTVNSLAGEVKNWEVTTFAAGADISAFEFGSVLFASSVIDSDRNLIDVFVPEGTDLSNLVADFTLSTGATATVAGVRQISASTTNDYSGEVKFEIESLAGEIKEWTVNVAIEIAEITQFGFEEVSINEITIDRNSRTISATVPAGTNLSALTANFTITRGSSASIAGTAQLSGVTVNNFTNPVSYDITSVIGEVKEWQVIVSSVAANINSFQLPEVAFSNVSIDFENHEVLIYVPQNTDLNNLTPEFTISQNAVATIGTLVQESGVSKNNFSNPLIYTITSEIGEKVDWKVIVKPAGNSILDFEIRDVEFQKVEIDLSADRVLVYIPQEESLNDLVTRFELSEGANTFIENIEQISGTTTNNFTDTVRYVVFSMAGDSRLWEVVAIQTNPAIVNFDFEAEEFSEAIIDDFSNTVDVFVKEGTDLTQLVASFELTGTSEGMYINGAEVISSQSVINYSNPITFQVKTVDGNVAEWQVNVKETNTDILAYSIANLDYFTTEINTVEKSIVVYVPEGTDKSGLIGEFIASPNALVYNGEIVQQSGITANDFTEEVVFTVEAAKGLSEDWKINFIEVGANFLSFDFSETEFVKVEIDQANQQITAFIPDDVDITKLTAAFEISADAAVETSGVAQLSQVTKNDFSSEVKYIVNSKAGDSKIWNVDVVPVSAEITSVLLSGISPVSVDINPVTQKATAYVYQDVDVSEIALELELSDLAIARISDVEFSNGTMVDFSTALAVNLLAETGHQEDWIIEVVKVNNEITNFRMAGVSNYQTEINVDDQLITVYVPGGSDVTTLVPGFELSEFAEAYYLGQQLMSDSQSLDFTNPVVLNIRAVNGSVKAWTIVVQEAFASILSMKFQEEQTSNTIIDEATRLVKVYVTNDLSLNQLTADFNLSEGAEAFKNGLLVESGVSQFDFSESAIFEVRSQANHIENWTVEVIATSADFRSFSFGNITNVSFGIDANDQTITCQFPEETDVSNLIASFVLSDGASAYQNDILQESGINFNDFTNPLTYEVISRAGEVKEWLVKIEFPEIVLSVDDISGGVLVYPVPATSYINIQLPLNNDGASSLQIFDLAGRKILQREYSNQRLMNVTIDQLKPQQYILLISGEDWIVRKNFVKVR
ncbi:MAG: T9SS type A sorting domain-containing protein [Bacteroidota bacterium]